ncbi:MAG: hypothetical protein ACRDQZ_13195 [Mycobacteriales bacterium]
MSDHQPALVPRDTPALADDLAKLLEILGRVERTQGRGVRPREVLLLSRMVRQYVPEGAYTAEKPELPHVLSVPACPGCGFAVERRGEWCAECRKKEGQYAKPLFEVAPQPTPAYARDHEAPTEDV